jgi:hypothetical protein
MPLQKSSLAQDLENIFKSKPASTADAASQWAKAYVTYAQAALSSLSSLPVTAMANLSLVQGAFTGGLAALSSATAGSLIAQGITSYWQAMTWVGPAITGVTTFPGNAALASALSAVFSDLSKKSNADKAKDIADAFDAGATSVMVADTTAAGVTTVGPIQ